MFTGGGSEADNLAVKGAACAAAPRVDGLDGVVDHRVSSTRPCSPPRDRLEREGFRVAEVAVTPAGLVDLDDLAAALDDRTAVVSVMLVNNETGIVQPLAEVAALVRTHAPAGAAAHRRGAGGAVARRRDARGRLRPDRDLGPQVRRPEGRRRARGPAAASRSTPRSRAAATNAACAPARRTSPAWSRSPRRLRITDERRAEETARIAALRDRLAAPGCSTRCPTRSSTATRPPHGRAPAPAAFPGVESETLLVAARPAGRVRGVGGSCSSGAIEIVARARGDGHGPRPRPRSSVRFSLGYASTAADVDRRARRRSPPRSRSSARRSRRERRRCVCWS